MNPVVKHGSRGAEASVPARGSPPGTLHVAFGVTEPDAGTDTTAHHHPGRARRRPLRRHAAARSGRPRRWSADKVLLLVRTTPLDECAKPHRRHDPVPRRPAARPRSTSRPIAKIGRNAVASCEVALRRPAGRRSADRVGEEGSGFRYLLDGLNPERILIAAEALGIGKVALRTRGRLRQRTRRVRPPDRQEPGHRLPAGRGPRPAARRRADDPRGVVALRRRACRAARRPTLAKYLAAEAGVLRRRPGHADARRLRLRHASTTSSATGASPGSCGSPRSPRR